MTTTTTTTATATMTTELAKKKTRKSALAPVVLGLLGLLPCAAARAQAPAPENTRQACTDRADNDGDGHVDCDDQDCQDLVLCARPAEAPAGAREPAGLSEERRQLGRASIEITVGAILLPLGFVIGGASAAPWILGAGTSSSYQERTLYAVGGAMDAISIGLMAAGSAVLAIGVGRSVRWAPRSSRRASQATLTGSGLALRF